VRPEESLPQGIEGDDIFILFSLWLVLRESLCAAKGYAPFSHHQNNQIVIQPSDKETSTHPTFDPSPTAINEVE